MYFPNLYIQDMDILIIFILSINLSPPEQQIIFNPFMPVAAKNHISLTKASYRKHLKEKCPLELYQHLSFK